MIHDFIPRQHIYTYNTICVYVMRIFIQWKLHRIRCSNSALCVEYWKSDVHWWDNNNAISHMMRYLMWFTIHTITKRYGISCDLKNIWKKKHLSQTILSWKRRSVISRTFFTSTFWLTPSTFVIIEERNKKKINNHEDDCSLFRCFFGTAVAIK